MNMVSFVSGKGNKLIRNGEWQRKSGRLSPPLFV